MTKDHLNDPPADAPMLRLERAKNKAYNERIKLLSGICNSVALAIVGLVALRVILDPAAQKPLPHLIVISLAVVVALEVVAFYILSLMKAES